MITQFFAGNYCGLFKAPFVAVEGALEVSCTIDAILPRNQFAYISKCKV